MSQRIVGLDIGSYSIKAALMESSFKGFEVVSFSEMALPATVSDTSVGMSVAYLLKNFFKEKRLNAETVNCAIPGDSTFIRFMDLPFADRKKIDSVIGFDLVDHLPVDINDIIFDYQIIEESGDKAKLLAVAVDKKYLEVFFNTLKQADIDPRILTVGPFVYFSLYPYLVPDLIRTVAFVDIGHKRTDLCVVSGNKIVLLRSIVRGGSHVTQQIADALEIEREKAQELKHSHGFIYSSESTIPKEHEPFFKAIRDGYSPIKRFIDISLMAAQNQSKTSIERIYISGGGAKIKGLYDYLESQLGMPFEPLIPSSLPFKGISSLAQDGESTMKAIGLSTQSIGVNRSFCLNFRKGDFAYAGEFKYVREKAWYFVLIGIFLLSLGIAKAIVRYTVLERQQGEYFQSLKDVSKDLFGKEETDFDRVLTLVSKKPSVQELEIIPQYSAFRILYDISQTLNTVNQMTLSPGTGEILPEGVEQPGEKDKTKDKAKEKLFTPSPDVNPGAKDPGTGERNPESENVPEEPAEEELKLQVEFDQIIINDAQVTLIGHANDVKAYNELSRKLQEHPCFKEKDAIKTESRGKVKFTRHRDWFQFAIMIQYKCPTRIIEKESQKKKSE